MLNFKAWAELKDNGETFPVPQGEFKDRLATYLSSTDTGLRESN